MLKLFFIFSLHYSAPEKSNLPEPIPTDPVQKIGPPNNFSDGNLVVIVPNGANCNNISNSRNPKNESLHSRNNNIEILENKVLVQPRNSEVPPVQNQPINSFQQINSFRPNTPNYFGFGMPPAIFRPIMNFQPINPISRFYNQSMFYQHQPINYFEPQQQMGHYLESYGPNSRTLVNIPKSNFGRNVSNPNAYNQQVVNSVPSAFSNNIVDNTYNQNILTTNMSTIPATTPISKVQEGPLTKTSTISTAKFTSKTTPSSVKGNVTKPINLTSNINQQVASTMSNSEIQKVTSTKAPTISTTNATSTSTISISKDVASTKAPTISATLHVNAGKNTNVIEQVASTMSISKIEEVRTISAAKTTEKMTSPTVHKIKKNGTKIINSTSNVMQQVASTKSSTIPATKSNSIAATNLKPTPFAQHVASKVTDLSTKYIVSSASISNLKTTSFTKHDASTKLLTTTSKVVDSSTKIIVSSVSTSNVQDFKKSKEAVAYSNISKKSTNAVSKMLPTVNTTSVLKNVVPSTSVQNFNISKGCSTKMLPGNIRPLIRIIIPQKNEMLKTKNTELSCSEESSKNSSNTPISEKELEKSGTKMIIEKQQEEYLKSCSGIKTISEGNVLNNVQYESSFLSSKDGPFAKYVEQSIEIKNRKSFEDLRNNNTEAAIESSDFQSKILASQSFYIRRIC